MSPLYGLKNITLLSDLAPKYLAALEAVAITRNYKKNSTVVTEGDETDSLYVIISGSVRIYVSDDEGREVTLNTLKPGDAFGELALLGDLRRSANVTPLEDSCCWVISKSDFLNCMSHYPQISRHIIKSLIERVVSLTDDVSSFALLSVYGRVRRVLMKDTFEKDGKLYIDRLTHQVIADRVGSSREAVSKILRELSNSLYISVHKKTTCIEKSLPKSI